MIEIVAARFGGDDMRPRVRCLWTKRQSRFFIRLALAVSLGLLASSSALCQIVGNYGNGADGSLTVSTPTIVNLSRAVVADLELGTTTIAVADTAGFNVGDEILVWKAQGDSAGTHEFCRVAGRAAGQLQLVAGTRYSYSAATFPNRTVVFRVPNYHSVRIQSGGVIEPMPWNGVVGGVVVFRADSAVIVETGGAIVATATGFRGGSQVSTTNPGFGQQGESPFGFGTFSWLRNGGGGGGSYENEGCCTEGGGGGGFGAAGGPGVDGSANGPGQGGDAYGANSLARIYLGSGGGSGECASSSQAGGTAGGLIIVATPNLLISGGRITANGANGSNACWGAGGGGSGGMVVLAGENLTLGPDWVTAVGGAGGNGGGGATNTNGGAGAIGRILVVGTAVSGSTVPPAVTNPMRSRMVMLPDSVLASLPVGDSASVSGTIRNDGDGVLVWNAGARRALALDGVNDRMFAGTWSPGTAWTVEAWVRLSTVPTSGRQTIAGGMNGCADWGIALFNGRLSTVTRPPGGACTGYVPAPASPQAGHWYHVAGVNNGQRAYLYVDGNLLDSAAVSLNYSGTASAIVGGEICCQGNNFPGLIDEVRVWNRALSPGEVADEFYRANRARDPSLVGYWSMDEHTSGAVEDLSGAGHTGTLQNGASLSLDAAPATDWLRVSPSSGTLPPLGLTEVTFTTRAIDLIGGRYTAAQSFQSNDPDRTRFDFRGQLTVSGQPVVAVLADSLAFGPLPIGVATSRGVLIQNRGAGILELSGGTITGEFSLQSPGSLSLRPGQLTTVQVAAAAGGLGRRDGSLVYSTNDPIRPSIEIQLSAVGEQRITLRVDMRRLMLHSLFDRSRRMGVRSLLSGGGTASLHDPDGDSVFAALVLRTARTDLQYAFAIDPDTAAGLPMSAWVAERHGLDTPRVVPVSDVAHVVTDLALFDDQPTHMPRPGARASVTHAMASGLATPVALDEGTRRTYLRVTGSAGNPPALLSARRYATGLGASPPAGIAVAATNSSWDLELVPSWISEHLSFDVQYGVLGGIIDPSQLRMLGRSEDGSSLLVLPSSLSLNENRLATSPATVLGGGSAQLELGSTTTANTLEPVVPGVPATPTPGDSASAVGLLPRLSWGPASHALEYDVYLWAEGQSEPANPTSAGLTGVAVTLSTPLGYANRYFWRVVAKNLDGSTPGATWTFRTDELPDLVASDLAGPTTAVFGQTIAISWRVTNVGNRSTRTDTWQDAAFLSPGPTYEPATAVPLGVTDNASALDIGQGYTRSRNVVLPLGAVGDYYLIIRTDAQQRWSEVREDNNFVSRPLSISTAPGADLTVDAIQLPPSAFSGGPFTVSWTGRNIGDGPTVSAGWTDHVYLSADATLDTRRDVSLGQFRQTAPVDAGLSYAASVVVTLPQAISGTYYVFVVTDSRNEEYEFVFEGNNARADTTQVLLTPPPDLVVHDVSGPSQAVSSQYVNVSWRVANEGPGDPFEGSWEDRVFLCPTPTFDSATAVSLGSARRIGGLARGTSYVSALSVQIPNTYSGAGYIAVVADYRREVFEGVYEGNNITISPGLLTVSAPDLEMARLTTPGSGASGTMMHVSWTIRNNGPGVVSQRAFADRVYLSQSPNFSVATSTLIATVPRTWSADVGDTLDVALGIAVPNGISGPWYLHVHADWDNRIGEGAGGEQNNLRSSEPLPIALSPWPNLGPMLVEVPTSATAGQSFVVRYSTRNEGSAAVAAGAVWKDALYISPEPILNTTTARLLANPVRSGPLSIGSSAAYSLSAAIPTSVTPGVYYAHLVTDVENAIYEHGQEGDNAVTSQSLALSAPPSADLVASGLVAPDSAGSGTMLRSEWDVSNAGIGPTLSSNWTDAVYLSADSTFDPAQDVLMGTVPRSGALAPGSSYGRRLDSRLPNGIQGEYRLLVLVDAGRNVNDGSRSNNVLASPPLRVSLSPSPNLVVTRLQCEPSLYFGDSLAVRFTLANRGNRSTNGLAWVDGVYLSNDQSVNAGDVRLGSVEHHEPIAVGDTLEVLTNVFVPSQPSNGVYYVIVSSDTRNDIYEHGGETDNAYSVDVYATAAAPADLVVRNASVPASVVPGETMTVTWDVINVGMNRAVGVIRDAVYFSADPTWTVDDPLAGTLERRIDLAPGAGVTLEVQVSTARVFVADAQGNIQGPAPSLTPGDFNLLLRTNIRRGVLEQDYDNNDLVAPQQVAATIHSIVLGVPDSAVMDRGRQRFIRIELPDSLVGQTLRVSVGHQYPDVAQAVYLRYGEAPTTSVFDERSDVPYRSEQEVNVPQAQAGTYFALITAAGGGTTGIGTVLARSIPFGIESVSPSEGGAGGRVTVRIRGTSFDINEPPTAWLRDGDGHLTQAQAIYAMSGTELYATFHVPAKAGVTYDVLLHQKTETLEFYERVVEPFVLRVDSSEVGLPGAFRAVPIVTRPLETRLSFPGSLRPGRYFELTAFVRNSSNIDIVNPLLEFGTYPDILTTVGAAGTARYGRRQVLCTSADGPAGVLRPGGTGAIRIGAFAGNPGRLVLSIRHLVGGRAAFNLDDQLEQIGVTNSDPLWSEIVQRLRARFAGGWTDYEAWLANAANVMYLERSRDFSPAEVLERALSLERESGHMAAAAAGVQNISGLHDDAVETLVVTPESATAVCTDPEQDERRQILEAAARFMDEMCAQGGASDAGNLLRSYVGGNDWVNCFGPNSQLGADVIGSPSYREWLARAKDFLKHRLGTFDFSCPHGEPTTQKVLEVYNLSDRPNFNSRVRSGCNAFFGIGGVNRDVNIAVDGQITITPRGKCGGGCSAVFSGNIRILITDEYKFKDADCLESGHVGKFKCLAFQYQECDGAADRPHGFVTCVETMNESVSWSLGEKRPERCDEPDDGPDAEVVGSVDPNDIAGPPGAGDGHWVALDDSLDYTIRFENDPVHATAPAQVVTLSQDLSPAADARSIRLGRFGFGAFTFDVPGNVASYTNRLDVRDSLGIFVDVTAGVDTERRRIFWTFRSIDPATGQAPTNPMAGFLPVNTISPRGEGFASYTVKSRTGLISGDTLRAKARIVFDTNDAIDTPEIFNQIDARAPDSRVLPLPARRESSSVVVTWSGREVEAGSGVSTYDVFVKRGGGGYELWQASTRDTSARWFGEFGETYSFYSIAEDSAGMREPPPLEPDAVVELFDPTPTNLSLVETEVDGYEVRLVWHGAEPGQLWIVERREHSGAWQPLDTVTTDASSIVRVTDAHVTGGVSYGYRLKSLGTGDMSPEAWVDIELLVLRLDGVRPNPSKGVIHVNFVLPSRESAELSIFDVAGRRVLHKTLGTLKLGHHTYQSSSNERLRSGVYFIRLGQGRHSVQTRFVVIE